MSNDDPFAAMDRMIDVFGQAEQHRRETADLLGRLVEIADALDGLEAHCRELAERGGEAPQRTVSVIRKQLLAALASVGVAPMDSVGDALDLDLHEVIETRPGPEEDVILEEVRRGYLWKGRLFRTARVIVAGAAPVEPQ